MKKGFTLIELLAVIVILAIIALIATPIVLSIIEETKESAVLRSAEYYLSAVENSIAKKSLSIGGSFSPNTCEVQEDGNLLCDETETLEVEVSGEKPSSGTITFEKGKIISVELTQSNKTIVKKEKGELVLGEPKVEPVCKPIDDVAPTGISPGDKYQCRVKDDMETEWKDGYYFFVLSTEEDGTTNLIMDRTINSDGTPVTKAISYSQKDSNGGIYNLVEWINQSDYEELEPEYTWDDGMDATSYGPITAMKFLDNATSTWDNISNLNITYTASGSYVSIEMTGKARLPYASELSDYNGSNLYLYEYLSLEYVSIGISGIQTNEISNIYGYWTLDFQDSEDAYYLECSGFVQFDDVRDAYYGVRPVINIKL